MRTREDVQAEIGQLAEHGPDLLSVFYGGGHGSTMLRDENVLSVNTTLQALQRQRFEGDTCYGHSFLPGLGFEVGLYRTISAPGRMSHSFPNEVRSFAEYGITPIAPVDGGYCSVVSDGKVHVIFPSTPKITHHELFAGLNGARGGDPWSPLKIVGDPEAVRQLKSSFSVRFSAHVNHDDIEARIIGTPEYIESAMLEFVETFYAGVKEFWALDKLYRHTDESGQRLFIDSGMQSPEYNTTLRRIGRRFLRSLTVVLRRYNVTVVCNWGLRNFIVGVSRGIKEYGLGTVAREILGAAADKTRSFFNRT